MAELTTDTASTSSCCSAEAQQSCCEPSEKASCCSANAAGDSCGCSAGQSTDIRETVRQKYAAAALSSAERAATTSCCGDAADQFGSALYADGETEGATAAALGASLGCGVPTAVADLHEGETVLDLGSGAGADVLISARRARPAARSLLRRFATGRLSRGGAAGRRVGGGSQLSHAVSSFRASGEIE